MGGPYRKKPYSQNLVYFGTDNQFNWYTLQSISAESAVQNLSQSDFKRPKRKDVVEIKSV